MLQELPTILTKDASLCEATDVSLPSRCPALSRSARKALAPSAAPWQHPGCGSGKSHRADAADAYWMPLGAAGALSVSRQEGRGQPGQKREQG